MIRFSENSKKKPAKAKAAAAGVVSRLKSSAPSGEKRKPGRPPSGREQVTLMISSDVLAKYKATGEGWRTLIDETLRAALDKKAAK